MQIIEIRNEAAADCSRIFEITELAFRGMPYAGGDEQEVIDRLRNQNDLYLSLVAEIDGRLVGQITFSVATLTPMEQSKEIENHHRDQKPKWFALGPVSVEPDFQGKGVGSALINTGLNQIEMAGALGCILTGNPAYYKRFGFDFAAENVPNNESEEFFMLKKFSSKVPLGRFTFHPAFYE